MRGKTKALVSALAAAALVMGLALCGCGAAAAKPEIKSLDPASGPPGSEVRISGGSFGATQGTGVVFFSGEQAEVLAWSDTAVTVKVPSGLAAAKYSVTVETKEGASNAADFEVTAPGETPKIGSLSPASGAAGVEVTISGSGFGKERGAGKVLFGTGTAEVVAWSDSSIRFKVPADAKPNAYGVTVETAAGKSEEAVFKVTDEDTLKAQKAAIVSYLKSQGQSTAGSEQWTIALVKVSSKDTNWEVVRVSIPGGSTFEAVLVFNNMLGDWECLATGAPPWNGVEFKGEPIPEDLGKV